MAQSKAILFKLARNAQVLGMTVVSQSETAVVIDNGSNDLTISYVDAVFTPSVMGGVDPQTSPFLGIGVGNPGQVKIKSAINTGGTAADVLDSLTAAKVLAMCAALANDLIIENSDASFSGQIRGHSDRIGLGQ